jgi:hypothetical protein
VSGNFNFVQEERTVMNDIPTRPCTHGNKAIVTNSMVSFCQACAEEILAEIASKQSLAGNQPNQSSKEDKKK